MSISSDDDYTSYYDSTAAECNQCHKTLNNNKQEQSSIQQKPRLSSKLNHLFKILFHPSCVSIRRQKKIALDEYCSCVNTNNVDNSKSSESMTFVDLPWIVPSEYHKTGTNNQWIFRTGWTPQPETCALLNSSQCGSCILEIQHSSSCGWVEK